MKYLAEEAREVLLNVFNHGIWPLLDLETLRQGERLEARDDPLCNRNDLLGLLRRPHGGSELFPGSVQPHTSVFTCVGHRYDTHQDIRLALLD